MKYLLSQCHTFALLLLIGCTSSPSRVSSEKQTSPAQSGPVVLLTAENMNANFTNLPVLNEKMKQEVASVSASIQSRLEQSGRKVLAFHYKQASSDDVAHLIQSAKERPSRLVQIYWTVDAKSFVYINIDSLPIAYTNASARFGSNAGTKFEILGPAVYSSKTAEQIADEFTRRFQ